MSFRALDFSVYVILTFEEFDPVILTFGHFIKSHLDLWTFRFYVISNFRVDISILCYFDLLTFHLKSFQPFDISYQYHFDLRIIVLENCDQRTFQFLLFRPSHISIFCNFDLWTFHQKSFRFWTFLSNVFSNFGLFFHFGSRTPRS